MKQILIFFIALCAIAQSLERPIIEVPDNLTADWFRQAYVIEHANYIQTLDMSSMVDYCTKNVGTLQKTRDAKDNIIFVCVPSKEK